MASNWMELRLTQDEEEFVKCQRQKEAHDMCACSGSGSSSQANRKQSAATIPIRCQPLSTVSKTVDIAICPLRDQGLSAAD